MQADRVFHSALNGPACRCGGEHHKPFAVEPSPAPAFALSANGSVNVRLAMHVQGGGGTPCLCVPKMMQSPLDRSLSLPKLSAYFYASASGREPVREWLKGLPASDRKRVGDDIRLVQFGWPLGMPVVRKLEDGIWEVRSDLSEGIARTLFTVSGDCLVLLHGFVKKSQRLPEREMQVARNRRRLLVKSSRE